MIATRVSALARDVATPSTAIASIQAAKTDLNSAPRIASDVTRPASCPIAAPELCHVDFQIDADLRPALNDIAGFVLTCLAPGHIVDKQDAEPLALAGSVLWREFLLSCPELAKRRRALDDELGITVVLAGALIVIEPLEFDLLARFYRTVEIPQTLRLSGVGFCQKERGCDQQREDGSEWMELSFHNLSPFEIDL